MAVYSGINGFELIQKIFNVDLTGQQVRKVTIVCEMNDVMKMYVERFVDKVENSHIKKVTDTYNVSIEKNEVNVEAICTMDGEKLADVIRINNKYLEENEFAKGGIIKNSEFGII